MNNKKNLTLAVVLIVVAILCIIFLYNYFSNSKAIEPKNILNIKENTTTEGSVKNESTPVEEITPPDDEYSPKVVSEKLENSETLDGNKF